MKEIIVDKPLTILRNKEKLEKLLNIKIEREKNKIIIEGSSTDEYLADQIIHAMDHNISYSKAKLIKKENRILEILNIKEYSKQKDLQRVKGRIIGKDGKVLKTLSNLTDSAIEIKNSSIAVISEPENVERTLNAIVAIIKGAKYGAVYKELEHNFPKPIYDLGLKGNLKEE